MEFSVVEFLLKEKNCEELMKKDDSVQDIRSLLFHCVAKTNKMSDSSIDRRIDIIRILLTLNQQAIPTHLKGLVLEYGIHIKIIFELIKFGADNLCFLEKRFNGETILHNASRWLNDVEYEQLIQFIPIANLRELVSSRDKDESTPLNTLVKRIEPTFVTLKRFHEAGADFNRDDRLGECVLFNAIKCGRRIDTLRSLVEFGARTKWTDVESRNYWDIYKRSELSLLHFAAMHGNVDAVLYFVDELGFDVNIADPFGKTPMDYSIINSTDILDYKYARAKFSIAKELSERGGLANVGHTSRSFYTVEINYEELAALTSRLADHISDDKKADYLRHILISERDPETKSQIIMTCLKVNGRNRLFDWVDMINECNAVSVEIIKYLVKGGANLLEVQIDGNFLHKLLNYTDLCMTSLSFHQICEYLIAHKYITLFSMKEPEKDSTPLHLAARKIELEERTLKLICDAGISLNLINKNGNNLLVYAVKGKRSVEMIKNLIKFGVNWKSKNANGWNLLHHSVNTDNIMGLKFFLGLGLSPNDISSMGESPLMLYLANSYYKDLEVIKLLYESGANINGKDNSNLTTLDYLHKEWNYDKMEILKYLVDKGADLYAKDDKNRTFIHKWITTYNVHSNKFHKFVECLIKNNLCSALEVKGFDDDRTPFHLAVNKIEVEEATLSLLYSAGVNFNAGDKDGKPPLSYAITGKRSLNLIDRLIKYGADMFHLDNNGRNILHWAAQHGNDEVLCFLITKAKIIIEHAECANNGQFHADLNKQDNDGNTPLHYAMLIKDPKILKEKVLSLLDAGADESIKNNKGLSPYGIILMQREDIDQDIKNKLSDLVFKYSKLTLDDFPSWLTGTIESCKP